MKASIGTLLILISFNSMAGQPDEHMYRSDRFADSCRKAIEFSGGSKSSNWKDALEAAECFGYLKGFFDGYNLAEIRESDASAICIPDNVSLNQVARLVVKTSDDHPEIGHYDRWRLVEHALKSTWS